MTADDLPDRLRGLALAAQADDLAAEAALVAERVHERRFHVACVGQFKRGKSTLLNCLLGRDILPTGVPPVTSVPTILRFGEPGARAATAAGWVPFALSDLAQYVTEERNPSNAKGVRAVEVSLPAPILQAGLCLVDTPGVGSVYEANSEATLRFVPSIDAAIVVLGSDPPIAAEELRLVGRITADVDTVLFVLSKVDRVSETERSQATAFILRVLAQRLGRTGDRVYQISATRGGGGPDWSALVESLRSLAEDRRGALVAETQRRAVTRIGRSLIRRLRERRAALVLSLEESAHTKRDLERVRDTLDRALLDLNPLFAAEEQRLSNLFNARADDFFRSARTAGLLELREAWSAGRFLAAPRRDSLEFANRVARGLVYPWLERAEREAERDYREAAHRFAAIAAEGLNALGVAIAGEVEEMDVVTPEAEHFRISRHFGFNDRMRFHYPRSPWPGLVDILVPSSLRSRRRQRRAEAYLLDLLFVNASRVAGDLAERVRESRREVEAEIRESLRRTSQRTADALVWAEAVRARGAEAVDRETGLVDALLREVGQLMEPVGSRAA